MIRFDCHAHVYEKVTAIPGARYAPKAAAPLNEWLDHQATHGIKGGVIVQVSFLGTDNSELCDALSKLDRKRFTGVGVVPLNVATAELDRLSAAGIRGIRWNLVRGADVPDLNAPPVKSFLSKLRTRNLHLEVHLEGPRLAKHLAPLADQGLNLVIDHFGLPSDPDPRNDPLVRAVRAREDRTNLFFKFSAAYRVGFDVAPHAFSLLELLDKDHIVWGSDWPHTQHEGLVSYAQAHHPTKFTGGISDATAAQTLYRITG